MNLYKSDTYIADLDNIVRHLSILEIFRNHSIFITGADGLICSALADIIFRYNETYNARINLYVAGRNEKKTRNRFSKYNNSPYFHFVKYKIGSKNIIGGSCDYVIHGAGNAYPSVIQEHPIATITDSINGIQEILEYAYNNNVTNTVFISSSEVYGNINSMKAFIEDKYGSVDILNPRSSYSVGKMAAETLCASYVYEKNIPVCIVRPGHIYGPTASEKDNRVGSVFAYSAARQEKIILKSNGSQIRSYCYMSDCAAAILYVLARGKAGEAYNISNMDSVISILHLAELYKQAGNTELKFDLPNNKEKAAFNPMKNSSLDNSKLRALGWEAAYDAKKGTRHTVKILREALL